MKMDDFGSHLYLIISLVAFIITFRFALKFSLKLSIFPFWIEREKKKEEKRILYNHQ